MIAALRIAHPAPTGDVPELGDEFEADIEAIVAATPITAKRESVTASIEALTAEIAADDVAIADLEASVAERTGLRAMRKAILEMDRTSLAALEAYGKPVKRASKAE